MLTGIAESVMMLDQGGGNRSGGEEENKGRRIRSGRRKRRGGDIGREVNDKGKKKGVDIQRKVYKTRVGRCYVGGVKSWGRGLSWQQLSPTETLTKKILTL